MPARSCHLKALSVLCSACATSPAGSGASRPPHSAPNEAGNYYPGWGGEDDLPGSEGCHFPDEELFLRHGTAVSPGPEEEDATDDIVGGPDRTAPIKPART